MSEESFNYSRAKNLSDQTLLLFKEEMEVWNEQTKKNKTKELYFKKDGNINVWYSAMSTHLQRSFDDSTPNEVLKELVKDRTVDEFVKKDIIVPT